jgi:SpoVK/Ycf46/Vps4 family AAA+-type ATPase
MSGRDLHKVVQELAVASHPRQPYFGDLVLALDNWRKGRSLERNEDATWDRIIVSQELKDTLQAYCRILKNYEEFKTKGVNIPRGLLLFGPSGTGRHKLRERSRVRAGCRSSAAQRAT